MGGQSLTLTEELEVLRIVTTGSIAANYHAVPRMTRDIDLVIQVSGVAIAVVAPEDLIISKLDCARDTRSQVQLAACATCSAAASRSIAST
jgi:hypothetical protein